MPVVTGTQYAALTDLANIGLIGGVLTRVTSQQQTAALVAASGIADSFLQSRYELPITQWGQDIVRAVCVIASYDLLAGLGYNPNSSPDQNVRLRYLDALDWLDKVGKQERTPVSILDSSSGATAVTTTPGDGSNVTSTPGGFQINTSPVRGWTNRGNKGVGSNNGFWDGTGGGL